MGVGKPDRNPAEVYLSRLAPGSRRSQRAALGAIAGLLSTGCRNFDSLNWASIGYKHTVAVRAALGARYSPNTSKRMLAALRGVLKECWRLGLTAHEEYARAAEIAPVRGNAPPRGRSLSANELSALFRVCHADLSPFGRRDGAIIAVLYGIALRRAELVALDLTDYEPQESVLRISGKGGTHRFGYLASEFRDVLGRWLQLRGHLGSPMFVPITVAGRLRLKRLSCEAVAQILRRRAAQAGVNAFSPHDIRRTTATHLLGSGVDLSTVQGILGHRHISTTVLYDKRGEEAKRAAVERLTLGLIP